MLALLAKLATLFGVVSKASSLLPGGDAATKATGALSHLSTLGAIAGAVVWIMGPGREWTVTLNALELAAVGLAASFALEWARRSPPPQ